MVLSTRLFFDGISVPLPEGQVATYPMLLLRALQKRKIPYYLGTVPWHVIQERRRKNKVAKQSRKRNR